MTDFLKKPMAPGLQRAMRDRSDDQIQIEGKSLPCTITAIVGPGLVQVKFEIQSGFTLPEVTVPVQASQFVQVPFFVGMPGIVQAADASLYGVSGRGGVASLVKQGNLACLAFTPVGATSWTSPIISNAVDVHGPAGAVIRDDANTHSVRALPSGNRLQGPNLGFRDKAPIAKPNITGILSAVTDPNAKLVLQSIIAALKNQGLAEDATT